MKWVKKKRGIKQIKESEGGSDQIESERLQMKKVEEEEEEEEELGAPMASSELCSVCSVLSARRRALFQG